MPSLPPTRPLLALAALAAAVSLALAQTAVNSLIHFRFEPIGFTLDSGETAERHAPETMAGGVAVFDYNSDGALDIFFTNGADIRTLKKSAVRFSNHLFAGDGRGHFSDVTAKAGLAGTGHDTGVAVGDYDNDGHADLFVGGVHHNTLYRGNADGTFTDVTVKAGLNKPDKEFGPLWSVGGAWLDANGDGLLDLFVANYLAWDVATEPPCDYRGRREYCHPKMYKKLPNQLYLNNGDGTFRDASAESGIRAHPGKSMGVGVADYDLDGWQDLFIANDKVYNTLFHAKGAAKFEEVAFTANVALTENGEFISGMGVDFRDLDNDGLPDIVVVALDDETFPVFRNTGKGDFLDVTTASRMGPQSLSMAGYSPTIADFDNDGWKDVFVTRGHVQSPGAAPRITVDQHNTVFRNLGGMRFAALTSEAGLTGQPPRRHRGSAVGDFNSDGRLDVVASALAAPAEIWLNDSPAPGHWLQLQLVGTKSNRDAIGARVKVVTAGLTQFNHVSSAAGYASSSLAPLHFGLGADASVRRIEIRWPSGQLQELRDVAAADRLLRVVEPGTR